MKFLILGAGRVGSGLAEMLVSEKNDVTVVDTDVEALGLLQERLDLRTVYGHATSLDVLISAGIEEAEMLIAVTASDEINLTACKLAQRHFNVPQRIVRLRSPQWMAHEELLSDEGFGVSVAISPEKMITDYLVKLIEIPEALQVLEFAKGRAGLLAVSAREGSPLVSHEIRELRQHLPDVDSRVVAIFREGRAILPEGHTRIEPNDEVFFLAASEHIRVVTQELRQQDKPVRRVMIVGGGNIGRRLAEAISDSMIPKIIEGNKQRCLLLAESLNGKALVLHGDATDEDLLIEENVASMDLFLALTNDDENNIMSALLAKRLGAKRVLALINRKAYAELMEGGRIDIALTPSHVTLGELLKYVRRGDVAAVHSLRRGAAEALELVVHGDHKTSKVVGRTIESIRLPEGAMIGGLVRGEGERASVIMGHHDVVIESGDHLIVFVTDRKTIPKVEKLFQVSAGFF
ncbi:MAG: Trk system potassium transport protein TrkA [Pseudomonadota bacterium]